MSDNPTAGDTPTIRDRNGYAATDTCTSAVAESDLLPTGHALLRRGVMSMALQVAVPMWISRMRRLAPVEIEAIARSCADEIASGGDNALYRGSTKKESADAFNAIARGLGALAFSPGGVTFLDCHWEAN